MKLRVFFGLVCVLTAPLLIRGASRLPSCLLSYKFGPRQYVMVVEKATQSLFVYSNYESEPVEKFTVTTGKEPGQKTEEGDMKTPEGIYFFRRVLAEDELPKADDYGEKAFTMNYPNPIDKKEERNGSGIWLHGAFDLNKTENPNNSRGCVVMQNDDLVKVSKYIFLDSTPIIIYDKIEYTTPGRIQEKRDRFIAYLTDWKSNWENKNIDGYIGYFDRDFRYRGMNVSSFKEYKQSLNDRYRFIKIILSKINLYAFNNYFVVLFDQLYISDVNHFYSRKIQYWEEFPNKAKILSERSSTLPQITKFEFTKGNYISIDEFRRDYLRRLTKSTVSLTPSSVNIKKITIFDTSVKIFLRRSGADRSLRVVPALLLNSGEYKSLSGIQLENGRPKYPSQGVLFREKEKMILLEREKETGIRSLTLFVINSEDEVEQIVTYYINR